MGNDSSDHLLLLKMKTECNQYFYCQANRLKNRFCMIYCIYYKGLILYLVLMCVAEFAKLKRQIDSSCHCLLEEILLASKKTKLCWHLRWHSYHSLTLLRNCQKIFSITFKNFSELFHKKMFALKVTYQINILSLVQLFYRQLAFKI